MYEVQFRAAIAINYGFSAILKLNSLDAIAEVQTANYCYGCTAGSGSSCGGALL